MLLLLPVADKPLRTKNQKNPFHGFVNSLLINSQSRGQPHRNLLQRLEENLRKPENLCTWMRMKTMGMTVEETLYEGSLMDKTDLLSNWKEPWKELGEVTTLKGSG